MIMRTTINTLSEKFNAPNKTIPLPLSIATARELYKISVNDLMDQIEQFNLWDFVEWLKNTKELAWLFWISPEEVWETYFKDILKELDVDKFKGVNNINYAPKKTVKLAWMAA